MDQQWNGSPRVPHEVQVIAFRGVSTRPEEVTRTRKGKGMKRLVVAALLAAGCATTHATMLDPSSPRPARVCPAGVQLFTDQSKVGKPYTELAILTWENDDPTSGIESMIKSQRKKAGDLGANGLILGESAQLQGRPGAFVSKPAVAIFIPSDTARCRAACRQ